MKLRNKKTGDIWDIGKVLTCDYPSYDTLEQINDEWEDYKPKEPLIEDEKIRKAVRAWAEANELDTAQYYDYWCSFRCDDCVIGFKTEDTILNLDDGKWYTIAELCGEEE